MQIDEKELDASMNRAKHEGFNRFMRQPMAGAMISMLPPSEHLEVILRACFDAGFENGCVSNSIELFKHLAKKGPR